MGEKRTSEKETDKTTELNDKVIIWKKVELKDVIAAMNMWFVH